MQINYIHNNCEFNSCTRDGLELVVGYYLLSSGGTSIYPLIKSTNATIEKLHYK